MNELLCGYGEIPVFICSEGKIIATYTPFIVWASSFLGLVVFSLTGSKKTMEQVVIYVFISTMLSVVIAFLWWLHPAILGIFVLIALVAGFLQWR